ncbi:bifunctional hydroxymethylpyrimidine kinase/phosphomethylpyrimidine kinase [Euryhalocaulis caribicus]|uniref:bifunctional hydroxymethylpyrimidine kinase/phosphomethylpyrimidine kinase n=1 Tax=Euryhalocaulis caribicus TaxID=1161401 RepID=UPI0003A57AB9|nr:bifunctional hydroxymethylpyrimidine kinase/phosphomethylpyrimidine kinase [Euryhalocaulis caribicus]
MKGRVLIIAGSDSGGGAGIQADIKSVTALGGYAMTAITALTAQNTKGVHGVHPALPDFVAQQIAVTAEDLGADAIKIGMLGVKEIVEAVADALETAALDAPLVLDPVMVAKGGQSLLDEAAVSAMQDRLIPGASLVTPNAPEAARLTGETVEDLHGQRRAGEALLKAGAKAVLIKGGHIPGDTIHDVLMTPAGDHMFDGPRIDTRHTHGTGCTLASAIATRLAQGDDLPTAVDDARAYVLRAIETAPGYGAGAGPLNHAWPCSGSDLGRG